MVQRVECDVVDARQIQRARLVRAVDRQGVDAQGEVVDGVEAVQEKLLEGPALEAGLGDHRLDGAGDVTLDAHRHALEIGEVRDTRSGIDE